MYRLLAILLTIVAAFVAWRAAGPIERADRSGPVVERPRYPVIPDEWRGLRDANAPIPSTTPEPFGAATPHPPGTPPPESVATRKIQLRIQGVTPNRGKIYLALYDRPNGFPYPQFAVRTASVEPVASEILWEMIDVPSGRYAIAAFQDLDADGDLNRSALGVPHEPYGFSNNARGRFSPPAFENASFRILDTDARVELTLK